MARATVNRFHPRRWTGLTWLAVLFWLWCGIQYNYPPYVTYTVDPVTGEPSELARYDSLAELPFPVGWPLFYATPNGIPAMLPIGPRGPATAPPPKPATIHLHALVVNVLAIGGAIAALVFLLQRFLLRFSLLTLLNVSLSVALFFGVGRLVVIFAGYRMGWWYFNAAYFLPIPAALLAHRVRFSTMRWSDLRRTWNPALCTLDDFDNPEDAQAAASQLDIRGDWSAAIDLYGKTPERWPRNAKYIQSCIERVAAKQSLSQE